MNHTPPHQPAAEALGGDPMIDTVPGVPPVKHSVWRTPAGDDPASITQRLAYRMLADYSEPGDTIVDLTDTPTVAALAVEGDRTHIRAAFADAAQIVVVATTPSPGDRSHAARVWRAIAGGGEPPTMTEWFGDDLRDLDRPAGTVDQAPPVPYRRRRASAPSLLIAQWPLHPDEEHNSDRLVNLMAAAVTVLRPGGCLVFVAARHAAGDYTAPIRAARAAGLRYTQHIVAVRAAVAASEFVYPPSQADLAAIAAAGVGHVNIHDDIIVLAAPGGDGHD